MTSQISCRCQAERERERERECRLCLSLYVVLFATVCAAVSDKDSGIGSYMFATNRQAATYDKHKDRQQK